MVSLTQLRLNPRSVKTCDKTLPVISDGQPQLSGHVLTQHATVPAASMSQFDSTVWQFGDRVAVSAILRCVWKLCHHVLLLQCS